VPHVDEATAGLARRLLNSWPESTLGGDLEMSGTEDFDPDFEEVAEPIEKSPRARKRVEDYHEAKRLLSELSDYDDEELDLTGAAPPEVRRAFERLRRSTRLRTPD
jgi:hypothetical protein